MCIKRALTTFLVACALALTGCTDDSTPAGDSGKQKDATRDGKPRDQNDGPADGPADDSSTARDSRSDQDITQSDGPGPTCPQTPCEFMITCCDGVCRNLNNDPTNCGACGVTCPADRPFCSGSCMVPPCSNPGECSGGETCCGAQCCAAGKICCVVNQGPSVMECHDGPACPRGCPGCVCAAPDTPIATPSGERAIAELRPGDLVFSWHRGALRAVPIARVSRTPVADHHVVRVTLDNGRVLNISGAHPTADGRTFDQLRAGDWFAGTRVSSVAVVSYPFQFTHDILPASDSGSYVAAGALIGTTLQR